VAPFAQVLTRIAALAIAATLTIAAPLARQSGAQQTAPLRQPDVIFVPTQDAVADAMLRMASVTKDDVVYDLGCGDGKLVITAAQKYGARAVGVDIDPQRIKEANANAQKAGVTDRVQFILGDIFDPNLKISDATVVTLYLLQRLNEKLKPRLLAELRPGTRVVSNTFQMGDDWPAEKTQSVSSYQIYFWTIPKR
jgi:ubiquinone/menaquinone biosynthesis C-methylase UbiE